jgi:hypothetical protein
MTLPAGSRVLACGNFGFWGRARVESTDGSLTRVRFVDDEAPTWLPKLTVVLDAEVARVGPERLAALPDIAPTMLPDVGAEVIALWDRKRFHRGRIERHEDRRAVVRFDEGDLLDFASSELLPCGLPIGDDVAALRARGLEIGAAVVTVDANDHRAEGWVSELGSGRVYVRWSGISYGCWMAPERVALGGRGRKREPAPLHPLARGARARVRWVDRELYDAVLLDAGPRDVRVQYDDGTEQTVAASRVIVVGEPPPRVPQLPARETVQMPSVDARVLAEGDDGRFVQAIVIAARGADVFVRPDGGAAIWVHGTKLAVPLHDAKRFPARGTAVVVEMEAGPPGRRGKKRASRVELRAGRVGRSIGDRVPVAFADGGGASVALETLWQRGESQRRETAPLPEKAIADVERTPDEWQEAQLAGVTSEGRVRVRFAADGKKASVDASRVRLRAPPPARAATPTPPPLAHVPSAAPDDRVDALLREIAARWASVGYRGDALASMRVDERAIVLPVEQGTLLVRIGDRTVEITVDTGESDVLPPVEAPLVRLVDWFSRLVSGPSTDARVDADAAWATTLAGSARAARAGGALTLTVDADAPSAEDVVRWSRAVSVRSAATRDA